MIDDSRRLQPEDHPIRIGFGIQADVAAARVRTRERVDELPALVDTDLQMDLIYTAETHNMPTGVCPFAGAETGTGGRLRDVQATGIGASYIFGTIGYCVGALNIVGDNKPYEKPFAHEPYPSTMASPLDILVEGSNGASDYGVFACMEKACIVFVDAIEL